MTSTPATAPATADATIVIPVHNDEEWIATALESCLRQTHASIEVICVDDASTDDTCAVIESFQARDARIQLVRMPQNGSALQARRLGVEAAGAAHVLFLDGDDELAEDAVETALAKARATGADLVGFGIEVINPDGGRVGGYQRRLAPVHRHLEGDGIVAGLFPVDRPAQGQLWRYLFSTELLRRAYALIPDGLVLRRVNDLPVMFLVAALAEHYVSITDRLYRYHFRRGGSGHMVDDIAQFDFYLGAVDSIESIADPVRSLASSSPSGEALLASYESARLSMIGNVLGYLRKNVSRDLRPEGVAHLLARVPERDVVRAAARFAKESVETLAAHGPRIDLRDHEVRAVMLVTATLTTGGVSGVLLSQARFLLDAGYRVVVAARRPGSDLEGLPEGAVFHEVSGDGLPQRMDHWAAICESESIDLIIDHQILYSREWPSYALAAKAQGAATIGWIHNFALRPVYDQKTLSSFLATHLNALSTVVTLSPLDVAFWKLRGVDHAVYLPNPPSPMLLESAGLDGVKAPPSGRLELIWVGRLDEHTKQVRQLVEVSAELRRQSADFRLRIIGPEWAGLTTADLASEVEARGLADFVTVEGPLRGQDLVDAIDQADVFVTTSIIEGYQLTLAEAQSRGLPVAMYELPWLTLVQDNEGLVAVPQGDAAGLAGQIVALAEDPERYARLSEGALAAARRAGDFDFPELYRRLVQGSLPEEFSPEPTLDDARMILDWTILYVERNVPQGRKPRRGAAKAAAGPRSAVGDLGRRVVHRFPAMRPLAVRIRNMLAR